MQSVRAVDLGNFTPVQVNICEKASYGGGCLGELGQVWGTQIL